MIAALAGSVSAAEPNSDDANLLKGPKVVDNSGPDGGDTMDGKRSEARPTGDMPFRAYLGAVRGLQKAAKDNPELALTDEQKDQIKAIGEAHKEKMAAFMEEHKEAFAEFRGPEGQRGQRGQNGEQGERGERGERKAKGERKPADAQDGQRGPRGGQKGGAGDKERARGEAGDRPSPEQRQQMREKMGELMAKAPSDQDAKKQLWAVLTQEQQAEVKENIATMRKQREQRVDKAMGGQGKGKGKNKSDRKIRGTQEPEGMAPIQSPIFEIDQPLPDIEDC